MYARESARVDSHSGLSDLSLHPTLSLSLSIEHSLSLFFHLFPSPPPSHYLFISFNIIDVLSHDMRTKDDDVDGLERGNGWTEGDDDDDTKQEGETDTTTLTTHLQRVQSSNEWRMRIKVDPIFPLPLFLILHSLDDCT